MTLSLHPTGGYHFLPGIAPYSCGVVASPGFEVVHVRFQNPVPWRTGFEHVDEFLRRRNRPRAALCAMSLRSPQPFTFHGFAEFNASYACVLDDWGVFVDGVNPVARTNVAPVVRPPSVPSLFGFAFTQPVPNSPLPAGGYQRSTFVVAGAGELPEGVLARNGIVALGDTSPAGLETKTRFVMGLMESRLRGLGVAWDDVNTINIYTAHNISPLLDKELLDRIGPASVHGASWHYSRPPIEEIEFEMDVRGVQSEMII